MGGNDAIFGPIKAGVQAACGEREEAKRTINRYKDSNPVVLGVRGLYHMAKNGEGERERGKALGKQGLKTTAAIVEGVVNGIPVLGHAKGAYHYGRGDKDRGDNAMKTASRSTAGCMGAVAGFAAGNLPGAAAGYVAAVNAADALTSGVESAVHGKVMLSGNMASCRTACRNPSVGNVFDAALGITMDVAAGVAVGSGLGEALSIETGGSSDLPTISSGVDTGGAYTPDASLGDSAGAMEAEILSGLPDPSSEAGAAGNGGTIDTIQDLCKIPECDSQLGTTCQERMATLQSMPTSDGVQWASVPESKRDWIQQTTGD